MDTTKIIFDNVEAIIKLLNIKERDAGKIFIDRKSYTELEQKYSFPRYAEIVGKRCKFRVISFKDVVSECYLIKAKTEKDNFLSNYYRTFNNSLLIKYKKYFGGEEDFGKISEMSVFNMAFCSVIAIKGKVYYKLKDSIEDEYLAISYDSFDTSIPKITLKQLEVA